MEGFEGWDDYAPFYDWENARTLGRRDVPFWRNLALHAGGPVLELGCGTGRISIPLARAGVSLIGIDRSAAMLAYARGRLRRAKRPSTVTLVQGDIRDLPFPSAKGRAAVRPLRDKSRASASIAGRRGRPVPGFAMVMAPYGILQSLLRERDLASTLADVHRVRSEEHTS